jgi:HprK-related kinase B
LGLERLLLTAEGAQHSVLGFADWACLQPGTLLSSPALGQLLPDERRAALARLPASDLWALHEPRELSALELRRVLDQLPPAAAPLAGIVSLAWQPASFGRCELRRTTLESCPELVSWLAKRAGPLCRTGVSPQRAQLTDLGPYLQRLGSVTVWELRGGVDFARARELCHELACS